MRVWLAAALLLVAAPAAAIDFQGRAEQGGLMRGTLPTGASALTLAGKPVPVSADGQFLIGFGRDHGAEAVLAWKSADGTSAEQRITVAPRAWSIQSLPNLPLRPVPDAEFERRRPAEVAKVNAARSQASDLTGWQGSFVRPAPGRVSGVFGSQRIYAGTPSSYHSGVDYAGGAGAAVVAPADGRVVLAEGPFTLEGNLVMIDHGFGLGSALMHLSEMRVKAGQMVKAGERLGSIGATGRVTGPHLHWGVVWMGERLDPARLLTPQR